MKAVQTTPQHSVGEYNVTQEKMELLKRTVCREADPAQFELFLHHWKRTGLDPFARQLHAVFRYNKSTGRKEMSIQTGIDGYRLIADRTGAYAGSDEPIFAGQSGVFPQKCKVTVHKLVGGEPRKFSAVAYWDEYYPGGGNEGFFWRKMPHGQLAKVTEALALRKAFPAEMSGIYTNEEMDQAQAPPKDVQSDPVDRAVTGARQDVVNEAKGMPPEQEQSRSRRQIAQHEQRPTSYMPPPAEVPEPENFDQPPPTVDNGEYSPSKRLVEYGKKYAGKTFGEVGAVDIESYLNWVKQNRDMKYDNVRQFVDDAESFLNEENPVSSNATPQAASEPNWTEDNIPF